MGKMIMNELCLPIYPETDYDEVGCGFIVGNLFFTAGHVIKDCKHSHIFLNGVKTLLTNRVFYSFEEGNEKVPDIAIYKLENVSSDTCFSCQTPMQGMELISESYHFSDPRIAVPVSCKANISVVEDMYFGAETSTKLWGGSSGSPVYFEGKVMGMLIRGNDGDNEMRPLNFCVFLSAITILNILKTLC